MKDPMNNFLAYVVVIAIGAVVGGTLTGAASPERWEYKRVLCGDSGILAGAHVFIDKVYEAPEGWEPCGLGHANGSVLLRRRVRW